MEGVEGRRGRRAACVRAQVGRAQREEKKEEEEGAVPRRGSRCLPQVEGGEGRAVPGQVHDGAVHDVKAAPNQSRWSNGSQHVSKA